MEAGRAGGSSSSRAAPSSKRLPAHHACSSHSIHETVASWAGAMMEAYTTRLQLASKHLPHTGIILGTFSACGGTVPPDDIAKEKMGLLTNDSFVASRFATTPAPAPAAQLANTNSMAQAVDLAHQQSESTPQLSFGQVRGACLHGLIEGADKARLGVSGSADGRKRKSEQLAPLRATAGSLPLQLVGVGRCCCIAQGGVTALHSSLHLEGVAACWEVQSCCSGHGPRMA